MEDIQTFIPSAALNLGVGEDVVGSAVAAGGLGALASLAGGGLSADQIGPLVSLS